MNQDSPMDKELILTMGLPYAGKSTWAKRQNAPIVSPDAVRLALHGERYLQPAEPWVWATAHTMTDALFAAGHRSVIVDATHTTAKRRQEWIDRHPHARIVVVVFPTDAGTCQERAIVADDEEILPVIERMAEEWEPVGGFGPDLADPGAMPRGELQVRTIHQPEETP